MENKKLEKEIIVKSGKKYYLLGKKDGKEYFLEDFYWNCNWYWGLGYVETFDSLKIDIESHQHFNNLFLAGQQKEDGNWLYHINEFFDESVLDDKESWELSDLFKSLYSLKEVAEVFTRGSSHYATSKEVNLKDEKLAEKINYEIMPKLFKRIRELLG